jgi:alpha-tubulin suppressor-like RCC1 family protein
LTNWASVSAGIDHALALKTDGTLWTWGNGYYQNLGFENNTSYNSPVQLGSLTTWIKLPENPGGYTISAAIST